MGDNKGGLAQYILGGEVTKSIEELVQGAYCADHLREDESGIEGAGRGAFAVRYLPKGTLVTRSPVWEFEEDVLDMYEVIIEREQPAVVTRSHFKASQQLIMNYCFKNKKNRDNMLYFPLALGVNLINHNRDQTNIRVELQKEGEEYVLDYITVKDVKAGDELFMDYGKDWEEAWEKHVNNFSLDHGQKFHVSASSLNDGNVFVRTVREQQEDPYPENIRTGCYYSYVMSIKKQGGDKQRQDHTNEIDISTTAPLPLVDFTTEDIDDYQSWSTLDMAHITSHGLHYELPSAGTNPLRYLRPCKIFARFDESETYAALMANHPNLPKEEIIPDIDTMPHVVVNIPREGVVFWDESYTNDVHLREGFRHAIDIFDKNASSDDLKDREECFVADCP